MAEAKYIFKRRTLESRRGRIKYGSWVKRGSFDTIYEAYGAMLKEVRGLYDRAIFYRGRRLTDKASRIADPDMLEAYKRESRFRQDAKRTARRLGKELPVSLGTWTYKGIVRARS